MPGAFVGRNTWQFIATDLGGSPVADITPVTLDPLIAPRISNPCMSEYVFALTPSFLTTYGAAVFANGLRRVVAFRNGQPVANDKVWRIKPAGGPTSGYVRVECMGAPIRWTKAYCRDANGQVFDGPSADGSDRGLDLPAGIIANPDMVVAAGEFLRQALVNAIDVDGDLEISLGSFSSTPTPGGNVAFAMRNLSPLRISELVALFTEAGALDVVVEPHGTGSSSAGTVHGLNKAGTARAISFDAFTGANNVSWAYPESDMDDFANAITYELGLREGAHFKNNVQRDAPGTTTDDSASRGLFGTYRDYQLFPVWSGSIRNTSNLFKMYVRRWNAEVAARMVPRTIVRVTPQAGVAPEPWDDYGLGDTCGLNVANCGIDISGASTRIVGWNTRPMRNGNDETELLFGWNPIA